LTPHLRRATAAIAIAIAIAVAIGCAAPIAAEEAPVGPPADAPEILDLEEAAALLRIEPTTLLHLAEGGEVPARRVGAVWRFHRASLVAWLAGETPAEDEPDDEPKAAAAPALPEEEPPDRIGEAPTLRTAEEISLRRSQVLLAPGEVSFEPGFFYSERSDSALVQLGTAIGDATFERETATVLGLLRVGVLEETEVFASTTYQYEDVTLDLGARRLGGSSDHELGDVRIGARRTLLSERVGWPTVVLSAEGRIPTHDHHTSWAAGGRLALIKSLDPVVLFANGGYRYTFSRDFDDPSRLEPEQVIDVTLGYAFALNDVLSLNTSVAGVYTSQTDFDDPANTLLRQEDAYFLQLGLTAWLTEGLYIEPSVSFDLSGRDNGFVLGVTLPWTFWAIPRGG
jgi:excisionase family DNA binding protein